jgi:hypothetical protein
LAKSRPRKRRSILSPTDLAELVDLLESSALEALAEGAQAGIVEALSLAGDLGAAPKPRAKPKPPPRVSKTAESRAARKRQPRGDQPTKPRRPRARIQSVYAGTRVGKRGIRRSPQGVNRHYEVYFFLREPASPEIAARELDDWLERRKVIVREWFLKTRPAGQRYEDELFLRFGTWVYKPETKEYRKAFDSAVDGTNPDLFDELSARDFIDVVPVRYFADGYLLAGVEVYFFTLPRQM